MHNRLKNILFLILLFPILIFSQDIIFSQEEKEWIKTNKEITYSEVDWKPLSIIENNQMKGIMGDYLELVSKKTDLKFKYIPSSSWSQVLEQFTQGKIDLVPGVGQSPQELKLGLISNLYAKYPMVIVTTNKYKYIDGIENLEGKIIAVPKNYTSYNFIVKNFPNQKIIVTKTISEALLLVENGKADAFVGHIATSLFYIAQNHLSDLKVSGKTSFDFEHHYLIQKDKVVLLSIINKVFDSISHQERKKIYDKWIQTSIVEKKIDYSLLFIVLFISLFLFAFLIYRSFLLKKYSKKLKKSHEEMKTIMNNTHEGIVISEGGIIIDANNSTLQIFNCQKEKIIGLKVLDLVAKRSKDDVKEAFKNKNSNPYEINIKLFDGKEIPVLVKGVNMRFEGKRVRVSSFIDISQLKNQEKLLIEQSNMAAMGEMASILAHQWRQPLAVINASVSSWKYLDEMDLLDRQTIIEGTDVVIAKSQELSETINNFIYLFETDRVSSKFFVEEIVEKILKAQSLVLKANNIKVIKNIENQKQVKANQSRFRQALFNVLCNSIEILSEDKNDRIIFISSKENKENITITILDTGGGFEDDKINEIFKPYYSTKDSLNGLGLGLYMTYTIIKKIKGEIIAQNESFDFEGKNYKGAKITIVLPILK